MYNFVYTHENPEWPIDIFHRYYVHSQLSPSLIETKRFLITDEGVDDLQDKTFIYPNGKLDDVGEVVKRLLEKRNFILVFTFDHEAFWGDGIKDVHNFIDKYNLPYHKIFVIQADMNIEKTYDIARKEYNLLNKVNTVYLDAFIYQNMDVFFEDQQLIHI